MDDLDFSNKCMNPSEVNYIIYHGNCLDGFGAAKCAEKYFTNLMKNDPEIKQPIYHAGKFNVLPPLDEIKDKCVLICDFSYKKDDLQKLLGIVKKLLILDHHKTAEGELKDLPNENKIFNMNHSGAYITWRFFFRNLPVPKCILYIEDNDIWKKSMPNTEAFKFYISSLPFTFEAYEKLFDDEYINLEVIPQGIGMVKQNYNIISKSVNRAAPKFIQIADKYYFVAHLNATELKSELGNKVFNEYPNINFSVIYSHNDYNNSTTYSLRSLDTATDVSEIAKLFGGGGHRNASGACVNYTTNIIPSTIIDNHKSYFVLNNIYTGKYMIGDDIYNVVYLNSTHYKQQLAKYLLQVRYVTPTGKNIYECMSIIKNIKKIESYDMVETYDIAAIWNYDGSNDCTWFTVSFKDLSIKSKLIDQFKKYDNFEEQNNTFVFSQKQLHNCLLNF